MKLRAYLVDDEPLALKRLRRLLEQTDRVQVIGSATEPEEAVVALSADPPDVCFLDIEMPRLNGFEVLARLPIQPIVIFTTAYNQYALQAFAVNSVDYLLKPVEPDSLERALNKIERCEARPRSSRLTFGLSSTSSPIRCARKSRNILTASPLVSEIGFGSSTWSV